MNRSKKNISILGSTGSVGAQTLEVARSYPEDFNIVCLGANKNTQILKEQILEFQPQAISCDFHKELSANGEIAEKIMMAITRKVNASPTHGISFIDSSQSRLNISASLSTSFGSDTDSDASDVSGTLTVDLDPLSEPFSTIQSRSSLARSA